MPMSKDSKYLLDSSQLEDLTYHLDQLRYHLKYTAISIQESINHLKSSNIHASYIKKSFKNLIDGESDGRKS